MIYSGPAFPKVIRCPQSPACGATQASMGSGYEDETVQSLRSRAWQVVDDEWTCPDHLPEDRKNLPGAMGRHPNPHCAACGDTRGGPYGHETHECTWELREAR